MSDTASLETPQHRPEGAHNPWAFVPALYFMQALPVTLVQEVAAIVYKDLGVENVSITRWTSLIALPWTIKLLLGPMVDLNFTKRGWTLTMQALLTGIMALVAFAVGLPNAFEITLGLLLVTAIFSAMCDIATDGFYLLALPKDRQAAFVGVQSTCYRLGRLFAVGMLVYLAGRLRVDGVGISASWTLVLACGTLAYALGRILVGYTLPRPEEDRPRDLPSGENRRNLVRTALVVALAFLAYFALSAVVRMAAHGLWYGFDGSAEGRLKGWMLGPDAFRNEAIQLLICSGLAVGCLVQVRQRLIGSEMGHAFSTYFRQPGIMAILALILFYRFGEAMVTKMAPLFLKDSPAAGGLGLPNDQLGLINGVAGVVGIVIGGLLGGVFVSKRGLRRAFWPMVLTMHTPNLLYLWASLARPSVGPLYGVAFLEQFGYGFGFAGYMVYLMQVAQRSGYKAAHYAIGTGLGAGCILTAGIASGIVQSNFGYPWFFAIAILATIPGTLTLLFLPIDPEGH